MDMNSSNVAIICAVAAVCIAALHECNPNRTARPQCVEHVIASTGEHPENFECRAGKIAITQGKTTWVFSCVCN